MKPSRTFRTIRGSNANYKCSFYTTKERRDAAGQRDANKDGQPVLLEEWTPELDAHNDVNQGWGCNGVARPIDREARYGLTDDITTCPRCGSRTDFEETGEPDGEQAHTCLNPTCGYRFLGFFDPEDFDADGNFIDTEED